MAFGGGNRLKKRLSKGLSFKIVIGIQETWEKVDGSLSRRRHGFDSRWDCQAITKG